MTDATDALDVETDKLNAALTSAENAIIAMHLHVTARVPLIAGYQLGFGKDAKRWKLLVYPETGDAFALANASRELRVAAAYKLYVLRTALLEEADKQRAAVKAAVEFVLGFCWQQTDAER